MARGRSEEARIRRHESRNEGTTGGLLQNDGAWHWPGTGTGMPAVTDVRVRVWVRVRLTSNKMLASEMKERDSANQRKLNNLLGSSRVPVLLSLSVSEASHQSQSQTTSSRDRASSSSPTFFLSCTTATRSGGPFGSAPDGLPACSSHGRNSFRCLLCPLTLYRVISLPCPDVCPAKTARSCHIARASPHSIGLAPLTPVLDHVPNPCLSSLVSCQVRT